MQLQTTHSSMARFGRVAATQTANMETTLIALAVLLAIAINGTLWFSVSRRTTSGTAGFAVRCMILGTLFLLCSAGVQAQPRLENVFSENPSMWGFALMTALGLVTVWFCVQAKLDGAALLGACLYIAGMLPISAMALAPRAIPSSVWALTGLLIMAGYSVFLIRHFRLTPVRGE